MPSPALDSVEKLRRVIMALEAGRAPGPGDGEWLASRLRRYLDCAPRGGLSLDLCLDLTPAQGGTPWWETERVDQRNAVIRAIAANHFGAQEPGPAARGIMAAWRRYSRNQKAIDRRHGSMGAEPGTLSADLFALARAGGPPEERSVRNIIAVVAKSDAA